MTTEFLRNQIVRLCHQPRSFEYLSTTMHGLDPVSLQIILSDLESQEKIFRADNLWVVPDVPVTSLKRAFANDPHLYLKKYMGHFGYLSHPHPLDYEWRNSMSSLKKLLLRVQKLLVPDDKILMLGMPTLFALASENDIAQQVTLVDRNEPITVGLEQVVERTNHFSIQKKDIITAAPQEIGQHFCAIMDPPWYSSFFYQFIWLAANSISVGGFIAISLPPLNTRPNILQERDEWFTFCSKLGLCIESLYNQELQYAMPFFEFNAFRAAGLSDILPFWRKGDLVILRKMEDVSVERPPFGPPEIFWSEREIGSIRLRINIQEDSPFSENDPLEFTNIVPGNILPTVSKRDALRAKANLWTSGNRIFNVSNPRLFLSTFDKLNNSFPYSENDQKVASFIKMIVELEQKEYDNYLEWLYHEMEREYN